MAKLKERIFAVPDGAIYPRWIEAGEDVTGSLEVSARNRGLIEAATKPAPKRKAMKAPENKAGG